MDHVKILKEVLENFIQSEGTDYLAKRGRTETISTLTLEENAELTRIRDEVRKSLGWEGY